VIVEPQHRHGVSSQAPDGTGVTITAARCTRAWRRASPGGRDGPVTGPGFSMPSPSVRRRFFTPGRSPGRWGSWPAQRGPGRTWWRSPASELRPGNGPPRSGAAGVEVGFGEITGLIGLSRRHRFRECLPAPRNCRSRTAAARLPGLLGW